MSDPAIPETQAEHILRVDESLVDVLESFEARLKEFSELIAKEREDRKLWIGDLIAVEAAERAREQAREKHARHRGYAVMVGVLAVILLTFFGYYRNEQVIACDRSNDIRRSTRLIAISAIGEVADYAEFPEDEADVIMTKVSNRANTILPLRDCHWWP